MAWAGGNFTRVYGTNGWTNDASIGTGIEPGRHDTQDNDLADGITACINKDGSNAMTGNLNLGNNRPINIIAGTAAAPAVCVGGDTNTGIFGPAADTWAVAANGAEVARITTTGLGVQTAPSVALHTVGNATFRGTANIAAAFQAATGTTNDACLMIGSTNGNTPFIEASKLNGGAGSATSLHIKTDNTTRVTVNATGEVGIGTSSIGGNLDVRTPYADADDFVLGVNLSPGNYYFKSKLIGRHTTSGGTAVVIDAGHIVQKQTSSLKYKTDVQNYSKGLATVKQLRPVQYKGINDGDKIFAGLVAEEVHEAGLTEFVVYDSNNEPEALAYGNMVALAFKAIQELNAKVEALEAQLASTTEAP